jgi:hypothetical protein
MGAESSTHAWYVLGMPAYTEEREFTLRFELTCEFPDDYEGEADGFAWTSEFATMKAELVKSAVAIIARHPGWDIRPGNRGRATEDEVTLVLTKKL